MTYMDNEFRTFYGKFLLMEMDSTLKEIMKGHEGVDTADSVVCCGVIDHEEGFCFNCLACADIQGEQVRIYKSDHSHMVKAIDVRTNQCILADQNLLDIIEPLKKIAEIHKENPDYREIRNLKELDSFRSHYDIDALEVYLPVNKDEGIYTSTFMKAEKLTDQGLIEGYLILQPDEDSHFKKGDAICADISQITEDPVNGVILFHHLI